MDTPERIERILRQRFRPLRFELHDESAKHQGHPGATSGGGHYRVTIVAEAFEGRSRLEQHRAVHEALGELLGTEVHALALKTSAPSEQSPEDAPSGIEAP